MPDIYPDRKTLIELLIDDDLNDWFTKSDQADYLSYLLRTGFIGYDHACNEIELYLDDLAYYGLKTAFKVSPAKALDFVEQFSLDDFKDICDMVIAGTLSEDWFVKIMNDHKTAKECFPALVSSEYHA